MSLETQRAGEATEARRELGELLTRWLPTCKPETIDSLTESARLRAFHTGDRIYEQGEPVPLTLIIHGYGAARRTTTIGQEILSGVAPAGELFGWSGISAPPSSVELVALTDGLVAQWPGTEVRTLAVADPALALAAIDSMAGSLHTTVELIEGFLHQDARRRVLRILARHRHLFFCEPAVLTRTHLPGLVGTTREMTSRVLRQLEHEGLLRRVGRVGLRLLQPDRLETGVA